MLSHKVIHFNGIQIEINTSLSNETSYPWILKPHPRELSSDVTICDVGKFMTSTKTRECDLVHGIRTLGHIPVSQINSREYGIGHGRRTKFENLFILNTSKCVNVKLYARRIQFIMITSICCTNFFTDGIKEQGNIRGKKTVTGTGHLTLKYAISCLNSIDHIGIFNDL